MSIRINLRQRDVWDRYGLNKDRELIALPITKCNVGEDESGEFGEWFFYPETTLPSGHHVIYNGYSGAHLPSEDAPHIFAELYDATDSDELAEFTIQIQHWTSQPERDPQP